MEAGVIRRDTLVSKLMARNPKTAREQRQTAKAAAKRVIYAYNKGRTPVAGDAVICALCATQLLEFLEGALAGLKT